MTKLPDIVPVSDLRQDAAAVLRRIRQLKQPLIVTQRGRAAAVMLSVEAYERIEQQLRLLRLFARGETEIAAGEGHSLASVLAEADALLAGDEP
jgi:prevent-host-death family protein